ncbi:unnamed protein product [Cyclocybe aegerita]|uniref:Uncharacterized protein n=1 Tax=Cyclocybe aegerita TaxID=1973307 RepID=A0A8S0WHQ7_CYCAE|nr:unnamed protein product [Cyclocybe aegerita]
MDEIGSIDDSLTDNSNLEEPSAFGGDFQGTLPVSVHRGLEAGGPVFPLKSAIITGGIRQLIVSKPTLDSLCTLITRVHAPFSELPALLRHRATADMNSS